MAVAGKRAYGLLFVANLSAMLGGGVATVALALLAFELAGEDAGAVLGAALALKVATNIVVAPLAAALSARLPRRDWMIALDLVRIGALLLLPLVDRIWEVFALIALFQAASAAFTACYLATVPDLLPDPADYARAVSKARVGYEMETFLSPLLAASLLAVLDHRAVFFAAAAGFAFSALLLATLALPQGGGARIGVLDGLRRLAAAPAMRGALALAAAATVVTAMVTVNSVVLVRAKFGLDDASAATALAAFGAGSVVASLALPRLIAGGAQRRVMLAAGAAMAGLLASGAWLTQFPALLALWVGLGACAALAQAPALTVLRSLAPPAERQGLYAAHFAATNALLLPAYLAAGFVGAQAGLSAAFLALAGFAAAATALAAALWPDVATPARR